MDVESPPIDDVDALTLEEVLVKPKEPPASGLTPPWRSDVDERTLGGPVDSGSDGVRESTVRLDCIKRDIYLHHTCSFN